MRRKVAVIALLAALSVAVVGGLLTIGVHNWRQVPPPPPVVDGPSLDGEGQLTK